MNERKIVDFRQAARPAKTPKKRRKKPKNFFFSFFIGVFILGVIYFATPVSRLAVIYFEGAHLLSRSDLIEITGLRENALIPGLWFQNIEAGLLAHPLVDQASVEISGMNRLTVSIREKEVMACANIGGSLHYILENGDTLQEYEGIIPDCRGLVVYGITEAAYSQNILNLFVTNLAELDPLFISLINHIEYEPLWGNDHRFSLSMRDGNTVKVDSHTMVEKLARYQTWASSLEEGVTGVFNFDVGNVFQPFSLEE